MDISWSKCGLAVKLLTTVLLMQCWKQAVITNCSRSHLNWSHGWAEKCKNDLISFSQGKPSSHFCRYEASCLNTAFKERPEGHFYILFANSLPAHWRTGMRREKGEQRWGQGIHHQRGQPTNPRNNFSGTLEVMAHVATCCEQQESLDAQNSWRHPVPALMTHVSVPWRRLQAGFHISPIKSVYTTCSCSPHLLSHTQDTWIVETSVT